MPMIPHAGRRPDQGVAAVTLAAALLASGAAMADDPCRENSKGLPVPGCVTQAHADTLKRDQTQDIDLLLPAAGALLLGRMGRRLHQQMARHHRGSDHRRRASCALQDQQHGA